MNTGDILLFLQEFAYLLGVFGFFLTYSVVRGRQAVINLVTGLYFALLVSLEFPYYSTLLGEGEGDAGLRVLIFAGFTVAATIVMTRLMPREYQEKKFESFGKKLLLAIGGTILIMVYSFHVLPVTDFVTPGTPIQSIFAPSEYFFLVATSTTSVFVLELIGYAQSHQDSLVAYAIFYILKLRRKKRAGATNEHHF